jgi:hypothetical protein
MEALNHVGLPNWWIKAWLWCKGLTCYSSNSLTTSPSSTPVLVCPVTFDVCWWFVWLRTVICVRIDVATSISTMLDLCLTTSIVLTEYDKISRHSQLYIRFLHAQVNWCKCPKWISADCLIANLVALFWSGLLISVVRAHSVQTGRNHHYTENV